MSSHLSQKESVLIVLHIGNNNKLINSTYLKLVSDLLARYKDRYIIDVTVSISKALENFKLPEFVWARNVNVRTVENCGADLYPYMQLLCTISENYNIIVKLHTKTVPYWSLELLRAVLDIDALSAKFKSDPKIGIIGAESWLLPTSIFLSSTYISSIYDILSKQFGLQSNDMSTNIDRMLKQAINPKAMNLDSFVCHDPANFNRLSARASENDHWKNIYDNNGDYSHGAYEQKQVNCLKFIAGTIFAMRGGELLNKYRTITQGFKFLIENIEKSGENGYVSDNAGRTFTYTHASERIVQVLCYLFGYTVTGVPSNSSISLQMPVICMQIDKVDKLNGTKYDILLCYDTILPCDYDSVVELCNQLASNDKNSIVLVNYPSCEFPDNLINIKYLSASKIPGSHNHFRESVVACHRLIELLDVKSVYINGLSSTYAIYAASQHNIPIIMHITNNDNNSKNINMLYHSQTLVTYDFMDYVDVILTNTNNTNTNFLQYNKTYVPQILQYDNNNNNNNNNNIISIINNLKQLSHPKVDLDTSMHSKLYSSYLTFSRYISYGAINQDLVTNNIVSLPDLITHHYHHGIFENRVLCRLPILCKPIVLVVLYICNTSDINSKQKIAHAQLMQQWFNVIVVLLEIGAYNKHNNTILSLPWEHPPIEVQLTINDNGTSNYQANLTIAKDIIEVICPDLVYVHSATSYAFYNAAASLNIPAIYHGWEEDLNRANITGYLPVFLVPNTINHVLCAGSAAAKSAMQDYMTPRLHIIETVSIDSTVIINLFLNKEYLRDSLLMIYPHFKWGATIYDHEKIARISNKSHIYLNEYQARLRTGIALPQQISIYNLHDQVTDTFQKYMSNNIKLLENIIPPKFNIFKGFK